MRKKLISNKTKLLNHGRFIRKVTTKKQGARKFCVICLSSKNARDCNYCWICGSKDHYVDKCPNKSKKKMSLRFLNVNLESQTSEYEPVFGYEVNSDDQLVYELILEYSDTFDSEVYSLEEDSKNEKDLINLSRIE